MFMADFDLVLSLTSCWSLLGTAARRHPVRQAGKAVTTPLNTCQVTGWRAVQCRLMGSYCLTGNRRPCARYAVARTATRGPLASVSSDVLRRRACVGSGIFEALYLGSRASIISLWVPATHQVLMLYTGQIASIPRLKEEVLFCHASLYHRPYPTGESCWRGSRGSPGLHRLI